MLPGTTVPPLPSVPECCLGPWSQLPGQRQNAASGTTVPPLPSAPECCLGPRSHLYRQRRNAAWDHGPICTVSTVSTGAIPKTFLLTHPVVLEKINAEHIY
ncbi:hypothetical protein FMJ62_22440 [Klebsiella pneumoniae]|nr:hypothetical protein [Klebsiella pneumoniae]